MRSITALAGLICTVSATPAGLSHYNRAAPTIPAQNATEPCALVAQIIGNNTKVPVKASLAYECLQSVPLNATFAAVELEGIKAFTEWQSTLAYLKAPPPGYLYPGVDIFAAFEEISNKLEKGAYAGEFDFQMDIASTVLSAHDGHFTWYADIAQVFNFELPNFYSVSTDGLSVPVIYLGEADLLTLAQSNGVNHTVSPVVQIDGEDVETWLNDYAAHNGSLGIYQDPDANYNAIFGQYAINGIDMPLSSYYYLSSSMTFKFANGTEYVLENNATSNKDLTGVVDGQSFYAKFCVPSQTSTMAPTTSATSGGPATEVPFETVSTQTSTPSTTGIPGSSGLPVPFVATQIGSTGGSVAGYYPSFDDQVAVLTITSFDATAGTDQANQFSNIVREFLATSQATGKKKLIIDLRDNGGGNGYLGYDLFSQLFPGVTPYGATNFRANPLFNAIGAISSEAFANVTNATAPSALCQTSTNPYSTYSDPWDFRLDLAVNGTRFTSWDEFYGPHEHYGDNFTSLSRYDLDNYYSFGCANISNYGKLQRITPVQVFQPEDILLVQNGLCSSTCAAFTEFMKSQAHVPQLVFGGRAQTGPMQGVGGVKGANAYDYGAILGFGIQAELIANPAQNVSFNNQFGDIEAPLLYAAARGSPDAGVNVRNNIRMNDTSALPLQFVYEAADCRLFYTAETILNPESLWQAAYNAHFGNASCVAGSTNQPSSGLGLNNVPPPSARNFFGANVQGPYPLGSTNTSTNISSTGPRGPSLSGSPNIQPSAGGAQKSSTSVMGFMLAAMVAVLVL